MDDTKVMSLIGVLIAGIIVAGLVITRPNDNQLAIDQVKTPTPTPRTSTNIGTTPLATPTAAVESMMQFNSQPEMILEEGKDYQAVLHTNKGDIIIDLHEKDTPITVNNFVFLAEQGFYKNVPFHRVIKGFMIQSGDPTGTGTGSPGYRFEDEDFTGEYMRGSVAMANSGPDTNGSQFFIMHEDSNTLPHNYVIFGKVIEGLDVVDAIADVPVKQSRTGELSAPAIEVLISDISIETI